jgi:hypothetical protein
MNEVRREKSWPGSSNGLSHPWVRRLSSRLGLRSTRDRRVVGGHRLDVRPGGGRLNHREPLDAWRIPSFSRTPGRGSAISLIDRHRDGCVVGLCGAGRAHSSSWTAPSPICSVSWGGGGGGGGVPGPMAAPSRKMMRIIRQDARRTWAKSVGRGRARARPRRGCLDMSFSSNRVGSAAAGWPAANRDDQRRREQ